MTPNSEYGRGVPNMLVLPGNESDMNSRTAQKNGGGTNRRIGRTARTVIRIESQLPLGFEAIGLLQGLTPYLADTSAQDHGNNNGMVRCDYTISVTQARGHHRQESGSSGI